MFITISIIVVFVSFTLAAASWIRLYFNKYEPVYIKVDSEAFVKNHIASRFCKIIISNQIIDDCMGDVDYIGLWALVIKSTMGAVDEIQSINVLHSSILGEVEECLDITQYVKLRDCLNQIETNLYSNLFDSNIPTPPYLTISTYLLWVEAALETFKKS